MGQGIKADIQLTQWHLEKTSYVWSSFSNCVHPSVVERNDLLSVKIWLMALTSWWTGDRRRMGGWLQSCYGWAFHSLKSELFNYILLAFTNICSSISFHTLGIEPIERMTGKPPYFLSHASPRVSRLSKTSPPWWFKTQTGSHKHCCPSAHTRRTELVAPIPSSSWSGPSHSPSLACSPCISLLVSHRQIPKRILGEHSSSRELEVWYRVKAECSLKMNRGQFSHFKKGGETVKGHQTAQTVPRVPPQRG